MLKLRGGSPAIMLLLGAWLLSGQAVAATVRIMVKANDAALADAVVSLHSGKGQIAAAGTTAVMDQRNSQFVPALLAVQAGTLVKFPNSDQIQHQVYSFSQPKRFQLPLYAGTTAKPVRFDQPGIVVLGCNIHDWMLGHIVVLDTPYFGKSGERGMVVLDVPPGRYQLDAWHPRLQNAAFSEAITVTTQGLVRTIDLGVSPAKADAPVSEKIRALQEKFRKIPTESP